MEDILASIRRILAEDEPQAGAVPDDAAAAVNGAGQPGSKDDVLVLDASMLAPAEPVPSVVQASEPGSSPVAPAVQAAVAQGAADLASKAVVVAATAATAVSTVGSASHETRPLVIRNDLPCFEDVVREALQPVIKQWLDAALPKLVERLVRTEVERVVGGVV